MANRIDGSPSGYLIPGLEFPATGALAPEATSPAAAATKKDKPAPYDETPSLGGLHDLFGLNKIVPEPSHIGPPPKPASLEGAPDAGSAAEAYLPKLRGAFSARTGSRAPSPEVLRMMDLLDGQREASNGIRARSGQGGTR